MLSFSNPNCTLTSKPQQFHSSNPLNQFSTTNLTNSNRLNPQFIRLVCAVGELGEMVKIEDERVRNKWIEINIDEINDAQRNHIARLPKKMTNRCRALMKQLICFSPEKSSVVVLLGAWVRSMKPYRADWLVVLKELENMNHPLRLEVWFF